MLLVLRYKSLATLSAKTANYFTKSYHIVSPDSPPQLHDSH